MATSEVQVWKRNGLGARMLMTAMGLLILCWVASVSSSVTYDGKALVIDGKRRILISGSIHYPRSTPEVHAYSCSIYSLHQ